MHTEFELMRKGPGVFTYQTVGMHGTLDGAKLAAGVDWDWDWAGGAGHGGWHADNNVVFWLITERQVPDNDEERIEMAIATGFGYGAIDGDHHKMWVIDQMIRVLAGERYEQFVEEYREGGEYAWDEGVAP
jgi:hypothetical protein